MKYGLLSGCLRTLPYHLEPCYGRSGYLYFRLITYTPHENDPA
jgi:hypothetical protein